MTTTRLSFIIALTLVFVSTPFQKGVANDYGGRTEFYQPTDDLDYSTLESTIRGLKLTSIEETLSTLKQKFPRSFEKYVLMYKSRSLQDASPLHPRALVVAGSKKMVFSFNGAPDQAGYDKLEILRFLPETSRFEFREIHFQNGKPPRFSKANPKKCMNCHQSSWRTQTAKNDPRPNWEPYNIWPGAFASLDINFHLSEKLTLNTRLKTPLGQKLVEDHYKEAQWMQDFETLVKPHHNRYKHLGEFQLRGPLEFTKVLAHQNSFRIARLITENKDLYKILRPTLARVFNSSCNFSVLPRPERISPYVTPVYQVNPLSDEIDAIFKPLGFDTTDWSMDFQTDGQFSFTGDRFQNPHDSRVFMGLGMAKYDPSVYRPINTKFFDRGGSKGIEASRQSCKDMENLSNDTPTLDDIDQIVSDAKFKEMKKMESTKSPLIDRCISCHDAAADSVAPWIAFDNFAILRGQLMESGYPRGNLLEEIRYRLDVFTPSHDRMPKGSIPKRSEVEALLKQIEDIAEEK